MDQETDNIFKSFDSGPSSKVVYRMVDEDHRGIKLLDPYFGVSIDGSPWYPVSQIMNVTLARAEMGFQEGVVVPYERKAGQ